MVRHHRWRRTGALIVLVAAVLVGCQPDEPDAPAGAVPDAPEPTTEPAEDPYAIPEEIDVAYLERVLEPIEETYGEAIREIKREQAYTEHADELLASIHTEEMLEGVREGWEAFIEADPELNEIRADPSPATYSVTQVVAAVDDCTLFRAELDDSGQFVDSTGTEPYFILMRARPSRAPNEFNPTPWVFAGEQFVEDDSEEPENPCG